MPCPYDQVRGHGLTYAPTDATVGGELVLGTGVQGREDARKPSHPCERGAGFLDEINRRPVPQNSFLWFAAFLCGGV
jgi:hypothetical protein